MEKPRQSLPVALHSHVHSRSLSGRATRRKHDLSWDERVPVIAHFAAMDDSTDNTTIDPKLLLPQAALTHDGLSAPFGSLKMLDMVDLDTRNAGTFLSSVLSVQSFIRDMPSDLAHKHAETINYL